VASSSFCWSAVGAAFAWLERNYGALAFVLATLLFIN
jgi:hypothetical protein